MGAFENEVFRLEEENNDGKVGVSEKKRWVERIEQHVYVVLPGRSDLSSDCSNAKIGRAHV